MFRVAETIPVTPGPLTLYYPKWIPGEHAPSGPIQNIAGLVIKANGKQLHWRRDLREMYAIHLDVPQGVSQLDLSFQFLSPGDGGEFGASASATPNLVDVEFNQVAFYPAGHYTRQITIQPSVTLPAGWKFGTALQVASQSGNTHPVQAGHLQQPGRFAADRRRVLQPGGPRSGRQGAGASECDRRRCRRRQAHRQAARRPARGGAADEQAVRRASLPALRLPADAVRPHRPLRPGAPPVQRRPPAGELLHRRHHAHAGGQPDAARIRALVERQVPPPGRPVDADLHGADAGRPAVGLRRASPTTGAAC